MLAVGNAFTVTVVDEVAELLHASLTVTVYVVVADGIALNEALVLTTDVPLLHEYVNGPTPEAVAERFTVVPAQTAPLADEVASTVTGTTLTVTDCVLVALQPEAVFTADTV